MPPVLLTPRELAKRLDVSYETVLTWARRDEVPSIRDGRNRLLFNLDSVLKALRGTPDNPQDAARQGGAS